MEQVQLPETITPFFTLRTTLDGAEYVLRFEWNMRRGWFLGLSDQDGDVIFQPKRLVPSWDLLAHCVDTRRPRGGLMAVDTTGADETAQFDDLGTRHLLVYLTEAELEAL